MLSDRLHALLAAAIRFFVRILGLQLPARVCLRVYVCVLPVALKQKSLSCVSLVVVGFVSA